MLIRLAAAVAAASIFAGCNVVAPVYLAIAGPGNVDREYELDEERSVVVFVDDPSNRIATRRIRLAIGESAQDEIIRRRLLEDGKVIDARAALAATSRDRDGAPLSIAEIGREVEADSVIYVLITGFNWSPVSDATQPYADVRIKVIDCENATRLWPVGDDSGYAMRVTMPIDAGAVGATSRSEALRVQRALAERAGVAIAQVFETVEITQSVRR